MQRFRRGGSEEGRGSEEMRDNEKGRSSEEGRGSEEGRRGEGEIRRHRSLRGGSGQTMQGIVASGFYTG